MLGSSNDSAKAFLIDMSLAGLLFNSQRLFVGMQNCFSQEHFCKKGDNLLLMEMNFIYLSRPTKI